MKKGKKIKTDKVGKMEAKIVHDVNVMCFSCTTYNNGSKICPNWHEMYHYFHKQEYPMYQQEVSFSDSQDDIEKHDYVVYANIKKSRIH